jgi:hypothetical protein
MSRFTASFFVTDCHCSDSKGGSGYCVLATAPMEQESIPIWHEEE